MSLRQQAGTPPIARALSPQRKQVTKPAGSQIETPRNSRELILDAVGGSDRERPDGVELAAIRLPG